MLAAVGADAFDVVAAEAPAGVEVRLLSSTGVPQATRFIVPSWREREIFPRLGELDGLEVVQVLSAGTDWIEAAVPAWATLCNARGARDAPVAEWVLGALLGARSGLLAAARERRWEPWQPRELQGARVVILGMGSIGGAVAARLAPFGVEVLGIARRARPGVLGVEDLASAVAEADALVVLAPLTDATRGLVDAGVLAALPDGALVLNAGRGPLADTDALLGELASGRLEAALDVTDPEPLPAEHPLWTAHGMLAITPHVSGDTQRADERAARFAVAQLSRWARGEALEAVVRPPTAPRVTTRG